MANARAWRGDHVCLAEIVVNAGVFDAAPPGDVFLAVAAAERDIRSDFLRNRDRGG